MSRPELHNRHLVNPNLKVVVYTQLGNAVDMARYSTKMAIERAGMKYREEFDFLFVMWNSSSEAYQYVEDNKFPWVDIGYNPENYFLKSLYLGWNGGYEYGFQLAPYVSAVGTDHSYYWGWLKNLYKHRKPRRIINCKLIESGACPSLHTCKNFGPIIEGQFNQAGFDELAGRYAENFRNALVFDDCIPFDIGGSYGHRLDASPFLIGKDTWDEVGPMAEHIVNGVTGDTDIFNRAKAAGIEITKALDAVSYHGSAIESNANKAKGIYS